MNHAAEKSPAWYVVYVRNNHEAKVESYLQSQGVQAFVPWVSVPSRRKDRFKLLRVPLFDSYVFVYTDLNPKDYYTITHHQSVVQIVGGQEGSFSLPADRIESLRRILAHGQNVFILPGPASGRQVRFIAGSLAGVAGKLSRRRGCKCRLAIDLEIFGKSVAVDVEVAENEIEPVIKV